MGVYIEFSTPLAADDFGSRADRGDMPQEITAFCNSWFVTDSNPNLWACETLVEVLDMLKESELKKLMPRRNEQLGPVAIMNPAVQLVTGQAAEGTGAAAGAPDNPEAAWHQLYTTLNAS